MKTDSPFPKFPSLSELLKHPTVQGVVERVNQTTIAQRATGFLQELQTGWKEHGSTPSISELAERLAQRLLGRSHNSAPTVNATGVICSQRWQAPLAEAAVHELLRFASDYQPPAETLLDQTSDSLVKLTGAEAAWVSSSYEAAITMASQCENATVVSSPLVGLLNPEVMGREHVATISDEVNEGADLVVVDGAGLLGGPRCGIVVGASKFVEQLKQSELAAALKADAMVLAALEATLEIYRSADQVIHQIPVLQLLSTPMQNLQQRCERVASLLADCEAVESAEPTACKSIWLDAGNSQLSAASWAIMVRPSQTSAERLGQRFEQALPSVVGRVAGDVFWLDFRAVFPRWDQQIVSALES